MSGADAEVGAALGAAREDRDSVVELTRQLVRLPSRAGIDPYGPVLECMSAWLDRHGLRPRQLPAAGGETVAIVGSLVLLFDVDEHTGHFGGAQAYFEGADAPDRVDGVMIGYPGPDDVVTGGRGVLRARLHVHGVAGHSGSRAMTLNAITKAAVLVSVLADAELPADAGPDFPLPPRLTVTEVADGSGYTAVPDLCTLNVDVRLTPAFDIAAAEGG